MKNVILFTIDTLRKDVFGCYGNKNKLTPFIDSLQERCIKFTNMQATGPYTQASFPGILTSSYYLEDGREKKLSPKKTLISEVLKKSGITTAGFHSNPYVSDYFGWNRGWDVFYDSMEAEVSREVPYIKGDEINKKVDEWLSSYIKGGECKPFFLWLHYMDVHEPYVPEKKYVDMVEPSLNLGKEEMFNLFKNTLLKRDVSDKGKVELLKKLYLAHVREVDSYVEEFFNLLKKVGLLQNSVIIITSDHGDEFGEHGGLSHDGKMYSELINVPFLIFDYAKDRGEVSDALVSNIDISPTIVHLFGLEPEKNFKGYPVLPLKDYPERGCFGEAIGKKSVHEKETDRPIYYYQKKELKIIYREDIDSWEMYDLKKDPQELSNIAQTSPQVDEMKKALKPRIGRWLKVSN
jgi:arylsulfatase A-like enzyme